MTPALRFIVHNWPLKVAAVGLATLLYAGFVVSRDQLRLPGPIPIVPTGLSDDVTVVENLPTVEEVRYSVVGPAVGALRPTDFIAEVDLSSVQHDVPVTVRVNVRSQIGGVVVNGVTPATINVTVESVTEKPVPVVVLRGPLPPNADAGAEVITPATVTVRGAASLVARVDHVTATVNVEPSALDIDRMIEPRAVDANGSQVPAITIDPRSVRYQLAVINDRESKSAVPITPSFAGAPATGYRVTGVTFDPPNVSLVGDADNLAGIVNVQTQPIDIAGLTGNVSRVVGLAPPQGLSVPGVESVTASVTIALETDNRTFNAGIELIGRDPALAYDVPTGPVTVAVFGSVLDLDKLAQTPLLVQLDVSGLGPGTHAVPVTPVLPASLTVSARSPSSLAVTVVAAPASSPPASSTP